MANRRVGLPVPTPEQWYLESAGLTKDRVGKLLERAVKKIEDQLDATHTKVFQHEGSILYSKDLVDHATQGKAAERALRYFLPHAADTGDKAPVYIMPSWAYGEEGREPATTPLAGERAPGDSRPAA